MAYRLVSPLTCRSARLKPGRGIGFGKSVLVGGRMVMPADFPVFEARRAVPLCA